MGDLGLLNLLAVRGSFGMISDPLASMVKMADPAGIRPLEKPS